jgi:hypothetical protein
MPFVRNGQVSEIDKTDPLAALAATAVDDDQDESGVDAEEPLHARKPVFGQGGSGRVRPGHQARAEPGEYGALSSRRQGDLVLGA